MLKTGKFLGLGRFGQKKPEIEKGSLKAAEAMEKPLPFVPETQSPKTPGEPFGLLSRKLKGLPGLHLSQHGRQNTKTALLFIILAIALSSILLVVYANNMECIIGCDSNETCKANCLNAEEYVIIENVDGNCQIICSTDNECDDANTSTTDICSNDGTCQSSCANILAQPSCGIICGTDLECDDNDANTMDVCENKGTCDSYCTSIQGIPQCTITCSNDAECNDNDENTTDICSNAGTCQAKCSNTKEEVEAYVVIENVDDKYKTKCSTDPECNDFNAETVDFCNVKKQECVNYSIEECGKECDFAESQSFGTEKFRDFKATNRLFKEMGIKLLPDSKDIEVTMDYRLAYPEPQPANVHDFGYSPTKVKQEILFTNNSDKRQEKMVQLQFFSDYQKFERNQESFGAMEEPKQLKKEERQIDFVLPDGEVETVKETIPAKVALLDETGQYAGYYDWSDLDDYNAVVAIKKSGQQTLVTTTFKITVEANSTLLIDPVYDLNTPDTTANAYFDGADKVDKLGHGGIAFGDADADGYNDDLILQAYQADINIAGVSRTRAGAAYLILNAGSKTGMVDLNYGGNYDANFLGTAANDSLGFGGVAFGDADADGYNDDVILQAYMADPIVETITRTNAGVAYLILNVGTAHLGQNDLAISTSHDANFVGAGIDDRLGGGDVAFGDADADGYNDDVILQAYQADPQIETATRNNAGVAYLILNVGTKTGQVDLNFGGNYDANFIGSDKSDALGYGGAAFGDADADGKNDDLVVQAYGADVNAAGARVNAGVAYLILNVGRAHLGQNDLKYATNYDANILGEKASDQLGIGGVAFGDADADGKNDDLVVQAAYRDPKVGTITRTNAGVAYLMLNVGTAHLGQNDLAISTSHDANFVGAGIGDNLGNYGIAFGDADADGYNDDLILQAYQAGPQVGTTTKPTAGAAYLILNVGTRTGQVDLNFGGNYDANFLGGARTDNLGYGGVTFGDADADGKNDDLVVQAHNASPKIVNIDRTNAGSAYLIDLSLTPTDLNVLYPINGSFSVGTTIDLNFRITDINSNFDMNIDINYSTGNAQGAGTVIANDLNLATLNCDSNTSHMRKCKYSWNTTGATAGNYYILAEIFNKNSAQDFNAGKGTFELTGGTANPNLDVNAWRVDGWDFKKALPSFSYATDGNLTIDFNIVSDTNYGTHYADLNYSATNIQGSGTEIVKGLVVDGNRCQTNFIGDWNNQANSDVNLVGYWKFDAQEDVNILSAFDYSGKKNYGQYINGADNNAQGKWDTNAAFFDGVDDYAKVSNYSTVDTNYALTIMFWLYLNDYNALDGFVTTDTVAPLIFETSNKMRVFDYNTTNDISIDVMSTDVIPLNVWTHYAFVHDAAGGRLYVNGKFDTQDTVVTYPYKSLKNTNVYFNSDRATLTRCFSGKMDEIKIYDKNLTASEISMDYNLSVHNFRSCPWDWNISGIADANYYANVSVRNDGGNSDFNASYSSFRVNPPPSDSCSCPASGNWEIINGDVCTLAAECNLSGGDLHIVSGKLTIASGATLVVPAGKKIIVEKAANTGLIVQNGGKLVLKKA